MNRVISSMFLSTGWAAIGLPKPSTDLLPALYETLSAEGFPPPLIVTPEEFSDAG